MSWGPLPEFQRNADDPEYKKVPPGSIYEFREVPLTAPIYVPELAQNRKCTDCCFAVLFILFILAMTAFTIYFYAYPSHFYETVVKPYHELEKTEMTEITEIREIREMRKKREITEQHIEGTFLLKLVLAVIGSMLGATLVLVYLMFISFHCNTRCTFWTLLVIQVLFSFLAAIGSWALVLVSHVFIVAGVINTIIFIGVIIFICCLRSKFQLAILIYEEAFDAIFTVKALLVQPLLTIAAIILLNIPWIIFIIRTLERPDDEKLNLLAIIFLICLTIMTMWIFTFLIGTQCIIVAGAVAAYYFEREKRNLSSPYSSSFFIYWRYHVGTVAAGSLIITIIQILKALAESAKNDRNNVAVIIIGCICSFFLECLEEIAQYMAKKAYIMTAIHGKALCASGKRAARLLFSNLLDTIAVEGLGACALGGAVFLIMLLVAALGGGILYLMVRKQDHFNWYLLLVLAVGLYMSVFLMIIFLQMVTVTIETIFLCFCEDKLLNDGSRSKPYCMSPRLLTTIQTAYDMAAMKEGHPYHYPSLYSPQPSGHNYPAQPPPQYTANYPR